MLANKAMNFLDMNKKRKLAADKLSLPTSKHQCWDGNFPSRSPKVSANLKADDFTTCSTEGKSEKCTSGQGPETGSAKDSNSFVDLDSSMSEQPSNYEVGGMHVLQWDMQSGSFSNCGASSQNSNYSSDGIRAVATHVEPINYVGHLEVENYEEALLEFDSDSLDDYLYSAYECSLEQYHDKETDENLCSNAANSNVYALSSGIWGVNREAQPTTRKPTIDKEFEEYFSKLML